MRTTRGYAPPAKLVPLMDAPEKFASQRLWRERDEAFARPLPPRTKLNVQDPWWKGIKAISATLDDLSLRSEPFRAMQNALLQKLRESKLEAWGVQSSPKQKRHLERIPSHFFLDAKVNWNRNSISNFAVTYVAVEICRPASALNKKGITSLTRPALGRPSKASDVERAIDILVGRGVDLATMSRPSAYRAIRQCAGRDLKANIKIGFSDPVIQRAMFKRFGRRR